VVLRKKSTGITLPFTFQVNAVLVP